MDFIIFFFHLYDSLVVQSDDTLWGSVLFCYVWFLPTVAVCVLRTFLKQGSLLKPGILFTDDKLLFGMCIYNAFGVDL